MTIRFATKEDEIRIIRAIQNKHMDYNQPTHVREDVRSNRLIVAEDKGKLLGSCALVYDSHFGYYAIKRLCVFAKTSRGKGVATAMVKWLCDYFSMLKIGATPWTTNPTMCHIFEKLGFEYQYTFSTYYMFYLLKRK